MVFTNEDKILVKIFRQDKGYSAKKINLFHFHLKQWSRSTVDRLLRKINTTGSVEEVRQRQKAHGPHERERWCCRRACFFFC